MSTMDSEINKIIPLINNKMLHSKGGRDYYTGTINNINVIVAKSEIGKVASAITTTTMIETFNIDQLIFTGVAGTPDKNINIGDLVVATDLFQHDMDCRPFYDKQVMPVLGIKYFQSNERLNNILINNQKKFLNSIKNINIQNPRIHQGIIASGDQFINCPEDAKQACNGDLVLALEMEGAAVAHVCHDYKIPFCVLRSISDNANTKSEVDYFAFVEDIASTYSKELINLYTIELNKN